MLCYERHVGLGETIFTNGNYDVLANATSPLAQSSDDSPKEHSVTISANPKWFELYYDYAYGFICEGGLSVTVVAPTIETPVTTKFLQGLRKIYNPKWRAEVTLEGEGLLYTSRWFKSSNAAKRAAERYITKNIESSVRSTKSGHTDTILG